MKHSKLLFGFIVILGFIFLIVLPVGCCLNAINSVNYFASYEFFQFGEWFLLCGTGLVTVGILGLDWQNVKKYRKIFIALYVLLIPITTFFTVLFASTFIVVFNPTYLPWNGEIQVANATFSTVSGNNSVITLSIENNRDSLVVFRVAKVNDDYYEIAGTNVTIAKGACGTVEILLTSGNYWVVGNDYKMDIYDSNNRDRHMLFSYQATATSTPYQELQQTDQTDQTEIIVAAAITIAVLGAGLCFLFYLKKRK